MPTIRLACLPFALFLAACSTEPVEKPSAIEQNPVLAKWMLDCFEIEGPVSSGPKLAACKSLNAHLETGGIVPIDLARELQERGTTTIRQP